MKKKIASAAAFITAIITVCLLLFYHIREKGPEVIRSTGTVEGTEVNIASMISGRIAAHYVDEGDRVQKSDILIELESDELEASLESALAGVEKSRADIRVFSSAIDTARAAIRSAEAEILTARAQMDRAQAQMAETERDMQRYGILYRKQIVPKASYESTVTRYDTATADYHASKAGRAAADSGLHAARTQLRAAESQLDSARASLKQSEANVLFWRARLAQTILSSPVSGTIVFKGFEPGETVSPGQTILTLIDFNGLYIRVDIEETLIAAISLNSQPRIRTPGKPGHMLEGRVTRIGRYGEFATQRDVTRGRQDIKAFNVHIRADDPAGLLKPGMTVEVAFTGSRSR